MVQFDKIPSPCYVIDENLLRRNLEVIDEVRKATGITIILALKGFAMWKTFPIFQQYGFNQATASSLNEAKLANDKMGTEAHTYCPAYSDDEFDDIARLSSHLTFNSLSQYHQFAQRARQVKPDISLGIRVNPEYSEVKTLLYNPCAPGSRLGVIADQIASFKLPDRVEGLHMHTLCESSSYEFEKTLEAFELRFGKYLANLKWVNFGGGHLMTRKDYNRQHLIEIINNFKKRYPHLEIILEPGAAFVWETGYLVATVLDIVENKGIKTAMLDVSFTAHMPDCLEMPYKPVIFGAFEPDPNLPTYRMGGNSCLSGDYMGDWSFDHELKIGERIIFNDMIHYTMVKTTMFNGVKHPSIGMWTAHNEFQLFQLFGYEDYKNRLS